MKTTMRRIAVVLMILSLMTSTAFAGSIQVTVNPNEAPKIHAQLEKNADKATLAEEKILLIAEDANAKIVAEIEKASIKADATTDSDELDGIIANLIKKTNKISAVSIAKIEKLGGEAICEWVEVEIGGQTISIDPIRIVRLR